MQCRAGERTVLAALELETSRIGRDDTRCVLIDCMDVELYVNVNVNADIDIRTEVET